MRPIATLAVGTAVALVVAPAGLSAQTFVDVSASAGFAPYSTADGAMAVGLSAADYDADGWVDFFLPLGGTGPDRLYRNLGDGNFEEIATDVGVASSGISRSALWFDYDGDGDLDLLVGSDCLQGPCLTGDSTLYLYRQDAGGSFTDVTVAAELHFDAKLLNTSSQRTAIAAGDLDNDGYLDFYAGFWGPDTGQLFFNQGDGTFTQTEIEGLDLSDYDWQTVIHDFDGDGWQDIFVAVDFDPNRLWLNQQDRTFVDVAENAGVDSAFNEMGVAIDDCDNDGDFDLYVTNIYDGQRYNLFLRNEWAVGDDCDETWSFDPCFDQVSSELGVADTYWGWGTTFIDGDNEGLLDIAATNGFVYFPWQDDPSVYFRNMGGETLAFEDVSDAVGVNDTDWGSALLALDFDRDGDLDLLQSTLDGVLRLRENQLDAEGAGRHYLTVRPRSSSPNSHAIGAVVRARTGSTQQSRLITAGTSLLGQEPAEAFFGLNTAVEVDELTVEWPDGVTSRFDSVAGDRMLTVRRGTPANLAVTIDDGVAETGAAAQLTYAVEVSNLGAGDVTDAAIVAQMPAGLTCTWQCASLAGSCTAGPMAGDLSDQVDLLSGGQLSYTVDCEVDAGLTGRLTSTVAVVPPGESVDPDLGDNTASDTTVILETGACGLPDHRYLVDVTVTTVETVAACSSILAGVGVLVEAGGELVLQAPEVGLASGASFLGELTVEDLP